MTILGAWDYISNRIWLEPFGTEDIEGSVMCTPPTLRSYVARMPKCTPYILCAFLFGVVSVVAQHFFIS
jgi:hypothetical protein